MWFENKKDSGRKIGEDAMHEIDFLRLNSANTCRGLIAGGMACHGLKQCIGDLEGTMAFQRINA